MHHAGSRSPDAPARHVPLDAPRHHPPATLAAAPPYYGNSNHSLVTIREIGYCPLVMGIGTGLADTTPVTVTLIHMGHVLPAVIVVGDRAVRLGPADALPGLLANGFCQRRYRAPRPGRFLREGIDAMLNLFDVAGIVGRGRHPRRGRLRLVRLAEALSARFHPHRRASTHEPRRCPPSAPVPSVRSRSPLSS